MPQLVVYVNELPHMQATELDDKWDNCTWHEGASLLLHMTEVIVTVICKNDKKIIAEDMSNFAFGKNDISSLY